MLRADLDLQSKKTTNLDKSQNTLVVLFVPAVDKTE